MKLPPPPVEWCAGMPADALARLTEGVLSRVEPYVTAETVERRREAEGQDAEGCLCCGEPTCYFASENVA